MPFFICWTNISLLWLMLNRYARKVASFFFVCKTLKKWCDTAEDDEANPALTSIAGFLSPCQAWDVTPRTLFHHLQFQVPVSVSDQKVHKKMAATHSFWSIFFTVLPLSGCKFHPVSVSTLGGPIWKSATNAETFPFRNSYCRFSFESPLSL